MPNSIYIHIPFCKTHCPYCNFTVKLDHTGKLFKPYIQALCQEINNRTLNQDNNLIDTLYLGGGTPSILPIELLEELFETLYSVFKFSSGAEITIECNPGTADEHKLKDFKKLGINRLSIGVQTFDDQLLQKLARGHNVKQAKDIILNAKKQGFNNISLDLIYGLPNQTIQSWTESIKQALELPIQHISCYGLTIEENTPFAKIYTNSQNPLLPPEESLEKMYSILQDLCSENGFEQYEVSNFAQKGFESKHNLNYWKNTDFWGFGVSAHEFVNGKRKANTQNLEDYIKNPLNNQELLETNPALEDFMLPLRTSLGLNLKDYEIKYKINLLAGKDDLIRDLLKQNLIKLENNYLKITPKGFLLSTEIIGRLMP